MDLDAFAVSGSSAAEGRQLAEDLRDGLTATPPDVPVLERQKGDHDGLHAGVELRVRRGSEPCGHALPWGSLLMGIRIGHCAESARGVQAFGRQRPKDHSAREPPPPCIAETALSCVLQ